MRKLKKVCAVLCAALSGLCLASAFAGEDNLLRFERIVGVITALNVDNPVGNIHSGTFAWTTRSGTARVNLTTGSVAFEVDGLVINGANFSGTPGPVTAVTGTLVCNAGGNETVFDTPATPLNGHGDAQFSGHFANGQIPSTCGNPIFLIRIAAPAGAAGRWIASGATPSVLDNL